MLALFILKQPETINYDVCRMRRYRQNILQWEENDTECMKRPAGNYWVANLFQYDQL